MEEAAAIRRGVAVAALSAAALAAITTFARLSYEAGCNPVTLVMCRVLLGVLVLPLFVKLKGGSLRVPAEARMHVAVTVVGLALISYGYMASVAYIPIGLAALLLYTFPLLVLIYECFEQRRLPGPRRITVFAAAFVGLALALGPSLSKLDPVGIGLALMASVGSVAFMISGHGATKRLDSIAVTAHANIFLLPITIVGVLVTGAFALPTTGLGWAALVGAGTAYLIGVALQFAALKLVSASLSSLVLNLEPVLSVGIAWIVVGETLAPVQLLGVGIAVAAITFGSRLTSH